MSFQSAVIQGFARIRQRLAELTLHGQSHDKRLVRLERQMAQILKDPNARPTVPGSPINELVDIVPVCVTEATDEENGEYRAVRQIPTSHGVMSNDPDDSTPLTIRTIKNADGDAATLSVGDKVYVKLDGVASDGTPYYHVITLGLKNPWYGIVTKCNSSTGRGKVKRAEGTIRNLSIVSGAEAVVVHIGVKSWARIGDEVQCVWNGSGITPEWTAHAIISGVIYEEPCVEGTQGCEPEDALAAVQDNPGQVDDCDDII